MIYFKEKIFLISNHTKNYDFRRKNRFLIMFETIFLILKKITD